MTQLVHSILVPLDGSPAGEHALPAAIGVACARTAALRLAHVVPTQASSADRARAQRYLDGVAQRLQSVAGVSAETAVLEDINRTAHHSAPGVVASPRRAVAHALAAAAEQPGVDFVVMTTQGRSGISRFWLGSVTEHVIHHAPEPILLVQPQSVAPDFAATIAFRRILVPLDRSKEAEQMLEHAVAFGQAWDAQYILLHVVDLQFGETVGALAPVPQSQLELDGSVAEARVYLEQIAQGMRKQGLTVTADVLVGTPPASVILDHAVQQHVDLIAIKTHGRSGLARLVIGSTADKVLRAAHVPVLLHRPRV